MNKARRNLLIGALALTSVVGCSDPRYLSGKVVKESGSVVSIVPSRGAVFGNESVKFGRPNYILTVDVNNGGSNSKYDGRYTMNVYQRNKSLAALAEAIEIGDNVRFPIDKINDFGYATFEIFKGDKIGNISSDFLSVIKKK